VSGQTLDLRRSARILWRHRVLVGAAAVLGLLVSAGHALVDPSLYTGTAYVSLPYTANVATQAVIAASDPVLASAQATARLSTPIAVLRGRVQAANAAFEVMSISAQDATPARAELLANAVASAYIAYASSASSPAGQVPVQLLAPATSVTGATPTTRLVQAIAPGALPGALIGVLIALAVGRGDRRLRRRDEIAGAIGVAVLASVRARRPVRAAGWTKLLRRDGVADVDAWRLRKVLRELGADAERRSLAVVSLSTDRNAVALGPELAVAAASAGIPTSLVLGPQQDPRSVGALRAACAVATAATAGQADLVISDDGDAGPELAGRLSVVVAVVDAQSPSITRTMRADRTLLGVTSGAVTAEQLARVAANTASDDRGIAGILVANPSRTDQTTGRLPQLVPPDQTTMPTRMTGAVTESRR
jgi:capsular polysaccharide biosynthesis protein